MFSSRSRILSAVVLASVIGLGAGCGSKKLSPETRIPGGGPLGTGLTKKVDTAPAPATVAGGGAGPAWQAGGGPDEAFADNSFAVSPADLDNGTGGIPNNADTTNVDMAQEIADLDMIHFDYDRSQIKPEWQTILDEHAEWLKSHPGVHVQVEGHCDERGTEEYNVSLGQNRADSVREYLVGQGVEDYRVSTISYGKLRPLTFEQDNTAHALNRRAMFLVYSPATETASAF